MDGRIAVGSPERQQPAALQARVARGALDATSLLSSDGRRARPSTGRRRPDRPALIEDLGARDADARPSRRAAGATLQAIGVEAVVLAGFMRLVGPACGRLPGPRPQRPPLAPPGVPGRPPIRDALAAGAAVTGVTVHLVDATLDGGPILLAEAVPVLPADDEASLLERLHAVEHRLLPQAVGLLLAGALRVHGRRVVVDAAVGGAALPTPRRALLSVSDKDGLVPFAAGLVTRGFELVSTGGTARSLREAGLPVTDVAAVTGFPEMLDGRVKTLHPRVHGGILADRRLAAHREQLAAAGIEPFELVVINLYPFAAAAERALRGELDLDGLVEQVDIGGPSMVRAAAKNHASVAIVTDPGRYAAILAALDAEGAVPDGLRAALAVEAFRHTAAYDARIAEVLPERMAAEGVPLPDEPGLPGAADPYPARLTVTLEKVETLRYGENPHQPRPATGGRGESRDGPFATGWRAPPGQGALLQQCPRRLGRRGAGPPPARSGLRHRQAHESLRAAERRRSQQPGADALAADPVSAFGGRRRPDRPVEREVAERLPPSSSRWWVARRSSRRRARCSPAKPNLRLVVDPALGADEPLPSIRPTRLAPHRRRGGAVTARTPPPTIRPPGRRHPTGPTMASGATWTSPGASSAA